MKGKRTRTPTNVRLDQGTRTRLSALARKSGLSLGAVIRAAVIAQLPKWEREGVTLTNLD